MIKRRTLLQAGAASLGAAAFPLPSLAGSEKKRMSVLGSEMAYVDTGSGRPIVFLHGNPTSSYLWRGIIPHVSDTHRAIAPDMIGMGDSDKPAIAYTYKDHEEHLFGLLDALDLQDAVLVIHDWGGALGFHYARTRPDRIGAIAFMETVGGPAIPFESYEAMGDFAELFRNFRTEGVGEKIVLEDNMFINQLLGKMLVATPLSEEALAEYNRYYPTAESRAPVLQWPREIPIGGEPAYATGVVQANNAWLMESDMPKLLFYAEPGAIIPPEAAEWLAANVPNLETAFVGAGVHYIQEDHPDMIGETLADWLTRV